MAPDGLAAELEELSLLLQRYVARHGHRMLQASGTLDDLYVSVNEARALLIDGAGGRAPPLDGWPDEAEVDAMLAARPPVAGPTGALAARFGLSAAQRRLLLAAAAPLLSVDLARLYTFAWADFAIKLPTVAFLCELVADDPRDVFDLRAQFHAEAPLVRGTLLELRDQAPWGAATPLSHRGVVVPETVLAALTGHEAPLPTTLGPFCRLHRAGEAPAREDVLLAPEVVTRLDELLARALGGRPRLLLIGPAGAGRRTAVAHLAAAHGRDVVVLDADRLAERPEEVDGQLGAVLREVRLRGAVLFVRFGNLIDRADAWAAVAARFQHRLEHFDGALVLAADHRAAPLHHTVSDLHELPLPPSTAGQQAQIWARELAAAGVTSEAEELSRRFSVTPGIIRMAVRDAVQHAHLTGAAPDAIPPEAISPFVRRRLDHALSEVAEPFSTRLDWADVVLPPDVEDALREIVMQARHRHRVFDEWGFGTKLSYGTGIGCLFSGPPGTGKTTMAGIIARSLGRELYRVDIARIVSKWVGETEKNLGRLFSEAERAQVILLFDEADSLFANRTEVKGANDRFANMEVNYLLQRMETYDGISILTTNMERAIDEAFKRRLRFRVHFPLPEDKERAELWRRLIPAATPVAPDLRFDELGRKFKISGGHIKNAVLRAAFHAADAGGPITFELLERAAKTETREMGRL